MRHLIETSRKSEPAQSRGHGDIFSLLQIELLVCLAAFLLVFLVTFSSCRRRCNNGVFRLIVFAAYTTSTSVLTYTLGLMRDFSGTNVFFAVWAMFLMIVDVSADSFSAFHLEDNEQWKKYNWQLGINFVWLAVLFSSYSKWNSYDSKDKTTLIALDCLFIVLVLKSHERAYALVAASRYSLERSAKVIVDYMCEEHKEDGAADDAGDLCMKNCYYLVRGEENKWEPKQSKKKIVKPATAPTYRTPLTNKDEVVTLDKVWKCEGELLSSRGDPDNKLKDYCLSFALYKLLRLRYAGYSLPQHILRKTWTLIKNELLSQQDGHQRAFKVVETELSYLFDFFYTKYAVIFHPGRFGLKLVGLLYFSIGIYATKLILDRYKTGTSTFVSTVMILAFIVAELMQLFFNCFSEWAKLVCICNYVQKKSWQKKKWIERMVKFVCWLQILRPWERKLGQYSFLQFYTYRPCGLIYNRISASYIDQKRNGQKRSKAIELTKDVKEAVFLALKKQNYGAHLENGRNSLLLNNVPYLVWACSLETQTHVILVWHIATSFCEHEVTGKDTKRNFRIAANLSNYLAYLVVFAPRLLPDHPYTAEYVFDQAILEAGIFFEKCRLKCKCKSKKKKMQARIDQMKKQDEPSALDEQTIIRRGVRLGNQIVNEVKEADLIWKILADFWVEMMLYVAPSDNAKAHAEHLTKGGEFVTHLWALLFHAGIDRHVPSEPAGCHNNERSNSIPN